MESLLLTVLMNLIPQLPSLARQGIDLYKDVKAYIDGTPGLPAELVAKWQGIQADLESADAEYLAAKRDKGLI